jgi:hypothetical protein
MKHLVFTIAFYALLLVGCHNNQPAITAKKAAKDSANFTTIQWVDSIVNFGSITYGDKISIRFRCKNTGDKPLIITNARPGCGCTVADFTKEPIAPGNEGIITAAFDSKKAHGAGEVRKTIMVSSNTKNQIEIGRAHV